MSKNIKKIINNKLIVGGVVVTTVAGLAIAMVNEKKVIMKKPKANNAVIAKGALVDEKMVEKVNLKKVEEQPKNINEASVNNEKENVKVLAINLVKEPIIVRNTVTKVKEAKITSQDLVNIEGCINAINDRDKLEKGSDNTNIETYERKTNEINKVTEDKEIKQKEEQDKKDKEIKQKEEQDKKDKEIKQKEEQDKKDKEIKQKEEQDKKDKEIKQKEEQDKKDKEIKQKEE